jgi:hypothetical protein
MLISKSKFVARYAVRISEAWNFRDAISISTAPTNHLLNGLGLNKNTRGQKGK